MSVLETAVAVFLAAAALATLVLVGIGILDRRDR